jgi:acetyl esterase/lipase
MPDAATDPGQLEPLTVAYGAHPSQYFHLHLPQGPGPHPAVVLIHGGFWRLPYGLDLMRPLAEDLVRRGFAAVNVEYRRLGEEGGGWRGTCDDVLGAVRALATRPLPLDLRRLGLAGHSAGGHLALWVASALVKAGETLAAGYAVVSLAGVTDLRAALADRLDEENGKPPAALEFMGGTAEERPDEYRLASPIELLPLGPSVTALLVHGDVDDRVPISQSLDYARAAVEAQDRAELARFPEMGHFEVLDPQHESWLAGVGFLTAAVLG